MNDLAKKAIVIAGVFFLGVGTGYFAKPTKVTITSEIKTTDNKVDNKNTDKQDHKKVIIVEKKNPDGTTTKTTTITDDSDTKTTDKITDNKTSDSTSTKVVEYSKPSLFVAAMAGPNLKDLSGGLTYGASVDKRFLGPIFVGGYGFTNGQFGVRLGLEF